MYAMNSKTHITRTLAMASWVFCGILTLSLMPALYGKTIKKQKPFNTQECRFASTWNATQVYLRSQAGRTVSLKKNQMLHELEDLLQRSWNDWESYRRTGIGFDQVQKDTTEIERSVYAAAHTP